MLGGPAVVKDGCLILVIAVIGTLLVAFGRWPW